VQAFYAGSEPSIPELDARLRQYQSEDRQAWWSSSTPSSTPPDVKEMNISQSGRESSSPRAEGSAGQETTRSADQRADRGHKKRRLQQKVYFSIGHGEHAVADNTERAQAVRRQPQSEGYQTDEILVASTRDARRAGAGDRRPSAAFTKERWKLIKDGSRRAASSSPCWIPARRRPGGHVRELGHPGGQGRGDRSGAQNPEGRSRRATRSTRSRSPRSSPFALATIFPVARSVSKTQ